MLTANRTSTAAPSRPLGESRVKIQLEPGFDRAHRPIDEIANFLTHGLGFMLSLAGTYWMMMVCLQKGEFWTTVGCAVYSLSLVSLYAASTLSHAFYDIHRRHFYRKIDQICIFYLIAGSFTPFGIVYLPYGFWPLLTITMWLLATTGTFIVLSKGYLSAAAQKIYLLLGWLPAISLIAIVEVAPREVVLWVTAGGFFYTVGTLFLWYDNRVRYFHAMWHAMVIAGSACHYVAILLMVVSQ